MRNDLMLSIVIKLLKILHRVIFYCIEMFHQSERKHYSHTINSIFINIGRYFIKFELDLHYAILLNRYLKYFVINK